MRWWEAAGIPMCGSALWVSALPLPKAVWGTFFKEGLQ